MYNILIVEDDKSISEAIEIYLKNQGYNVFKAGDGIEALERILLTEIHLAIVDIMMPKMNGTELIIKIREKYDFPVIILSAKSEELDKIMGLNIGADDYVTKPFQPMELMARVNSQLRRYFRYSLIKKTDSNEKIFTVGGLELNDDKKTVNVDGEMIKMTPSEFKILRLLIKNPGRVYSTDEIYERIWNEKAVNTDTIMVHIRNIREKIEINPKKTEVYKSSMGGRV